MRSAGCVINDFADRNLDGHVERTKLRPLASGEVNSTEAILLFFGLLTLAFLLVLQFNTQTIMLALPQRCGISLSICNVGHNFLKSC